ncbi:hypothetical protein N9K77_02085 [bacterium]|nr:hypothetical protein [bacterium]
MNIKHIRKVLVEGYESTLNIENLTNGVYLMEMKLSDGSTINSKIIKK